MAELFFYLDDVSCETVGLHITSDPEIPAPIRDREYITIPGRDGVLTIDNGRYEEIEIELKCTMTGTAAEFWDNYRVAKAWLLASHDALRFSDDGTHYYKILAAEISSPSRIHRRAAEMKIKFTCDPYMYLVNSSETTFTSSSTTNSFKIKNGYNESAAPVYTITGSNSSSNSGYCDFILGNSNGEINIDIDVSLNNDGEITIDTARFITYDGESNLAASSWSGAEYEELFLTPGNNIITITSGYTVVVSPNWREL